MAVFVSAIVVAVDVGTVAAVATAVAETGIALNVVGHLTGNQTLEKVGGVMSMAGGVVGLAAGAFSTVAGTEAADDLGGGLADTSTSTASTFNDATNTLTNADGSVVNAGTQLPVANVVDGSVSGSVGGAADAGGLSGAVNGAANAADATPIPNVSDASLTNPSTITQTPLDANGAANGANNALNPTGSTAPSLSGDSTATNLNPTGSSATTASPAGAVNGPGAANPGAASTAPSSVTAPSAGPATSNASATLSANGGNSSFALQNQNTSSMLGENANTTAPGTLIPGQSTPVNPGGDFNDATGTYTSPNGNTVTVVQNAGQVTDAANAGQSGRVKLGGTFNDATGTYTSPTGNTITVGQNAEQVTDAANANQPGILDGITNWVKNNQTLSGQLASGAVQALNSAYAARKNNGAANQLALQRQIQANRSAQVAQRAPSGIISGARSAYEMIVLAFANGDRRALKDLLSSEVYDSFDGAIRAREKAEQKVDTRFVSIDKAELVGAESREKSAQLTVRFVSQMISVTRDKTGTIVDGNPDKVTDITDVWTFARDTTSRDPNWKLVGTGSAH